MKKSPTRMLVACGLAMSLAGGCFATPAFAQWRGYEDIPSDHWAVAGGVVDWSLEHGAVLGVDESTWMPDAPCDRAQAVTILWRLAGEPAAESPSTFGDVSESDWFHDAVSWAQEQGIVSGIAPGVFDPYGHVTREQVAKIMCLFSGAGVDGLPAADLAEFADSSDVSDWAVELVGWAVDEGVISGRQTDAGPLLAPTQGCTRAEYAAMAARVFDGVMQGEDIAGKRYEVQAAWTPEYEERTVPVYEDRWVDDVERIECSRTYCLACGFEAVIPLWIMQSPNGMAYDHPDWYEKYKAVIGHVQHNDCGADFAHGTVGVDVGSMTERVWAEMPTGSGHWEKVQVGTKTELVEVGGRWEWSEGRWV